MNLRDGLTHVFAEIGRRTASTVEGLDAAALAWRPDAEANSIAWLVWHLARVQDGHVAEIAGRPQVWTEQSWAEQFGLPAGYDDSGYGHTPAQVGEIQPGEEHVLRRYAEAVATMVRDYLDGASADDFDRVIDRSYDPPVTVGVRLFSVVGDALQHLGQAAYIRGLYERRS